MLVVLLPASSAIAQIIGNLDFRLQQHGEQLQNKFSENQNQFQLSLSSQLFSEPDNKFEQRIEIAENFSDIGSINIESARAPIPTQLDLRTNRLTEPQRFTPTITLSSSYEENAIGLTDTTAESLSIRGESGRLLLYGQLEQQRLAALTRPTTKPDYSSEKNPLLRASVRASDNNDSQRPEAHEKNAALASRYYLEAVYNFNPSLQGKVSFRRSMIDTFDSEEKLQVEGIVEANRNMLIKAGYNNEIRPEITDTKSSKDTKVWTEFILKFWQCKLPMFVFS